MLQVPTFVPIHLPHASLPESLRRSSLWVDAEVATSANGDRTQSSEHLAEASSSKGKGSGFQFSKAVRGISKVGQTEESSYHGRGDGKFQDGSNFVKQ